MTPGQVHRSLGDFAALPDVRTALASATSMGFCPVQHEVRDAETGCEHWEGRGLDALRAWWHRRRGVDPDVALADLLAAKRREEEHARLLARGAAARGAVPDPVCPVCKREHATCSLCHHRRPTCGVCDVCGLEGVVVTSGPTPESPATWYCSRAPTHHGVGLPAQPEYPGGVCPGCQEVVAQREVLERALERLPTGTPLGLQGLRHVAPALSREALLQVIEAQVVEGRLARALGYATPAGFVVFPDQAEAKSARAAGRAVVQPGGPTIFSPEILDLWVRL